MFKESMSFRVAAGLAVMLVLFATLAGAQAAPRRLATAIGNGSTVFLPLVVKIPPPLRIEAGATTSYTDSSGNTWNADADFLGGQAGDFGSIAIANTSDPRIYQTERFNLTGYAIPVENGSYTVRLHFAENFYTAPGKRVLNVNVEGTPINNLDVFAEAGGIHRALVKTTHVTVADQVLTISITASAGETMIDGIEVTSP